MRTTESGSHPKEEYRRPPGIPTLCYIIDESPVDGKDTVSQNLEQALRYLEKGNRKHREGDIDGAIESYKESIRLHPTADAHTFLGWMYSFQGRIEDAINECKTAIILDPDFGNPYNDIGVYLMQQGRLDEAEPWFRKAMQAQRYGTSSFSPFEHGAHSLGPKRIRQSSGGISKGRRTVPQ